MSFFSAPAARSEKSGSRIYYLAAGLFFLALELLYYLPSLRWLPRGIHEWGQADRLSLAISFYDNGLRFFRPQTQNLMSIDGVTGVEFPLLPYLAALSAKLLGRDSLVPCYRALTASLAWLSYFSLFRLVFERTRQFVAALLPGVFLATSPVFAYYAGNFLPDPAGASVSVVAAYYLLRYAQRQRFRDLVRAIGVFTLATLLKTSAAGYLLAALGTVLLWTYLQPAVLTRRQKLSFLALSAGSIALVVGYALFNRYLNAVYGSMFLAQTMPIETEQQYQFVMRRIREVWWAEYFTPAHYGLLIVSLVIGGLRLPRLVRTEGLWVAQLALAGAGGLIFFLLLGRQLADHDYYVLAPYWPGLSLLVALATVEAANWRQAAAGSTRAFGRPKAVVFGGALLALLGAGIPAYRARMGEPYPPFSDYYAYHWMQGGAVALRAAGVPPTATLLVLGENAPNLSLVYFDRRGLVWKPDLSQVSSGELLGRMRLVGLDYLVMRRAVFENLAQTHPDLLPAFTPLVRNGRYVVLRWNSAPPHW